MSLFLSEEHLTSSLTDLFAYVQVIKKEEGKRKEKAIKRRKKKEEKQSRKEKRKKKQSNEGKRKKKSNQPK